MRRAPQAGGDPLGVDNSVARDYQWPPRLGRLWYSWAVRYSVVGAVLASLLTGCSKPGSTATLAERAEKYWELKQTKRWEEVYDGYLDPALKGTLSKEAFLKKRLLAFDILTYTIGEVQESGDRGTVRVEIEANLPIRQIDGAIRLVQKRTPVEDEWARREGVWYVRLSK